jgi:replicative DNA helicase
VSTAAADDPARYTLPLRANRSARSVLSGLVDGGHRPAGRTTATGFVPLDHVLGGGLHAGELLVLAGKPGVGKTTAALQWARRAALQSATVIYASVEHDDITLLTRLLGFELAEAAMVAGLTDSARLDELRGRVRDVVTGSLGLGDVLVSDPLLAEAANRLEQYSDRLVLVAASRRELDRDSLIDLVADYPADRHVVLVDHLQRSTKLASLKRMALNLGVSVVVVAPADQAGLRSRRMHLHHLGGSAAMASEADAIVVMNDKRDIVDTGAGRRHPSRSVDYERRVVFSVEKNRNGVVGIDLEFARDFENFRFNPAGQMSSDPRWPSSAGLA